jgi:hypothetical protein
MKFVSWQNPYTNNDQVLKQQKKDFYYMEKKKDSNMGRLLDKYHKQEMRDDPQIAFLRRQ